MITDIVKDDPSLVSQQAKFTRMQDGTLEDWQKLAQRINRISAKPPTALSTFSNSLKMRRLALLAISCNMP